MLGLLWVYTWVGSISFVLFYSLHFFNVLRVKRHEEEVRVPHAVWGEGEWESHHPSDAGQPRHRIPVAAKTRGHGVAAETRDKPLMQCVALDMAPHSSLSPLPLFPSRAGRTQHCIPRRDRSGGQTPP